MMKLIRTVFENGYTGGELYLNGSYFCDTLEDEARPQGVKIPGKTCIPAGKYKAEVTWSPAFKRDLILIKGIEGWSGVRIHAGNDIDDTEGCPMVGVRDDDSLKYGSRDFENVLTHICSKLGEFDIEIINKVN